MSTPNSSPLKSSLRGNLDKCDTKKSPTAQASNALSTLQLRDRNTLLACSTDAAKSSDCVCYNDEVSRIAEQEIGQAHYRLEMGVVYLLDEENAMEKARTRASDFIIAAIQEAKKEVIVDSVGEKHTCERDEAAEMEPWQRWHVEWKCDQAETQFQTMMDEHPQREHWQQRCDRNAAASEAKWGPQDHSTKKERAEDVRDHTMYWRPYKLRHSGCECVLWGAGEIASTAWNEAIDSFEDMYPVASDWGDLLLAKIQESTERALNRIKDIQRAQEGEAAKNQSTDHFPEWQQAMVKERVDVAVKEVIERIRSEKGAPGAVAHAAAEDAEEHCRQYRIAEAAKEVAHRDEESPIESTRVTTCSNGGNGEK